ncbi:hypothetical protein GCM10010912_29900 [Paenibacillus albidus]|uniref:Uncharacterized protein n=1 Tax=Paenibacillus albidus TaxID=2041023 RepID=A0A917CB32_9BACL|nr:hypothetical protein [Paenibacillus albidus]GGF82811.1 hypothetical protein GCM10010912_29900 [Paenibacillus albidus]
MKKKIMLSCLTAAMSLAVAVPLAFAQDAPTTDSSDAVTPSTPFTTVKVVENDGIEVTTITGSIFQPFASHQPVNQALTSSTGSQTVEFYPDNTFGYYRVWIANYSTVRYNSLMTDMNNAYQGEFYILPGQTNIIKNTNKATTGRRFSVTSSDGSKLNGSIAVRLAETAGELD